MLTGRVRKIGFVDGWLAFRAKANRGSASMSKSDSIGVDFRTPSVPQGEGQCSTYNAGSTGATIPCLRAPYSTQ